jgi:hypothetical protein
LGSLPQRQRIPAAQHPKARPATFWVSDCPRCCRGYLHVGVGRWRGSRCWACHWRGRYARRIVWSRVRAVACKRIRVEIVFGRRIGVGHARVNVGRVVVIARTGIWRRIICGSRPRRITPVAIGVRRIRIRVSPIRTPAYPPSESETKSPTKAEAATPAAESIVRVTAEAKISAAEGKIIAAEAGIK